MGSGEGDAVRSVCYCCEEGFYCRHRCPMHPKDDPLGDSGKPWREKEDDPTTAPVDPA